MKDPRQLIAEQLNNFEQFPRIRTCLNCVLCALPHEILEDFCKDPTFRIILEDFVPGKGWKMFMAIPRSPDEVTRCVVLRPKLEQTNDQFSRYVIAHELAHAYLRNGGLDEIRDPEVAADTLAERWGFSRPLTSRLPDPKSF